MTIDLFWDIFVQLDLTSSFCNLRQLVTNFIMKHTVDLNYSAKNPNSSSVIRNFHKCKKLHLLLV